MLFLGWVAIAVCLAGRGLAGGAGPDPQTCCRARPIRPRLMGVLAAAGFAVAAVGIRGASNSLGDDPVWNRALFTLTVMLGIQTLINGTS